MYLDIDYLIDPSLFGMPLEPTSTMLTIQLLVTFDIHLQLESPNNNQKKTLRMIYY